MNIIKVLRNLLKAKKCQNPLQALDNFIEGICLNNEMPKDEARKNLESAVVEVVSMESCSHHANGLLITTDGYFVTNLHCVLALGTQAIVLDDGNAYPINKVCAWSEEYDIVLLKADIPVLPEAIKYTTHNERRFPKSSNCDISKIKVLTRWQKKIKIVNGISDGRVEEINNTVDGESYRCLSHIQAKSKCGDSGGIVILAQDYKVYGMLSCITESGDDAFFAQWFEVFDMIDKYIRRNK